MPREAKLFKLNDKEWEPLVESMEKTDLDMFLSVYKFSTNSSRDYIVLSLSEDIDEIILKYGASELGPKDLLRNTLPDAKHLLLYGSPSNTDYLEKIN